MRPTSSLTSAMKSTNVRSSVPRMVGLSAARLGFRVLSPSAPALAARYAERLFLTAQRRRRPKSESAALATAAALRIPHDGHHLPAWRWGEGGPTVVLVHGWEGRGSQLFQLVRPLVREGFRVVVFDAPGHGDAPSGVASVVDHARALASVGRALGPVHAVVGHSVGGSAALLSASRFGFVAGRFVLVGSPVSPARFADGFARVFGLSEEVRGTLVRRVERRYGIRWEELDARAAAAAQDAPLLVIHDEHDRVVPFDDGAAIASAARRGQLVRVSGLGHHRIVASPEVADAVASFVSGRPVSDRLSFAATLDGELFFRARRWSV